MSSFLFSFFFPTPQPLARQPCLPIIAASPSQRQPVSSLPSLFFSFRCYVFCSPSFGCRFSVKKIQKLVTTNITSSDPKTVIENIQNKNSHFKHISQAQEYFSLLDIISSDIYSDENRFIIELLQNCDDSSTKLNTLNLNIYFNDVKNRIIFSYNGSPFTEQDVWAICSSGKNYSIFYILT